MKNLQIRKLQFIIKQATAAAELGKYSFENLLVLSDDIWATLQKLNLTSYRLVEVRHVVISTARAQAMKAHSASVNANLDAILSDPIVKGVA